MLKGKYSKFWHFHRAEAGANLFRHCNIFTPFAGLKGVREDVKIRGDLPQKLIDELTAILTSADVSVTIKKKKAQEDAARQARPKKPDQQRFWREMWDKYAKEGDQGMVDMMEKMMRHSVDSPALMRELMKPLTTQGDLRRSFAPRQPPTTPFASIADADGFTSVTHISDIGMLDGKPVFSTSLSGGAQASRWPDALIGLRVAKMTETAP
ncbi:hypothetical protein B0A55_12480 [Friedmanniomyces simplex]|uniref:Uncharacterized protein n=1 Tax=Friedmanniomyces simplex TaxID=329884 RepID=A0A4U0W270_9PEZI|nr:hypothetical protein B0A55_12480 [Friedmanniomyces simplex]